MRRGPTLFVDGEHQGPVAGVQLHEHRGLDQVLGQVAQEGDCPAKQVHTGSGLRFRTRARTQPPSGAADHLQEQV